MRFRLKLFHFFLVIGLQAAAQNPFHIRIDRVYNTIPGFHSGAAARSGNHVLLIGGRTNGLHGFSSNDGFERQYANNRVIVIDTTNWQSYTASLSQLPLAVADPLRSTNMQSTQVGNKLYMTGGFGWDSIQNKFVTFPVLSVIHVDSIINAVMTASSIAPCIRQLTDTIFRACGGEMRTIGPKFYLIGGHNFNGRYTDPPTPLFTQVYLRTLRIFNITDQNNILAVNNYTSYTDSAAFHRRDMTVAPQVRPGYKEGHVLLGGVFTSDNTPFQNPVHIDSAGYTVDPFVQKMNQYTTSPISLFDTISSTNYHILPGGISLYDFNQGTQTYDIDSLSPFVNKISILSFPSAGTVSEHVSPTEMPALLGSNMVFIPAANTSRFANDVIRIPVGGSEFFAGYLIGGIRASGPNFMPSTVNDSIYKIFIRYSPTGTGELNTASLTIFPNPAGSEVSLLNGLTDGITEILDESSKMIYREDTKNINARQNRINLSPFMPGFYIIRQVSGTKAVTARLIISR